MNSPYRIIIELNKNPFVFISRVFVTLHLMLFDRWNVTFSVRSSWQGDGGEKNDFTWRKVSKKWTVASAKCSLTTVQLLGSLQAGYISNLMGKVWTFYENWIWLWSMEVSKSINMGLQAIRTF